MKISMTILFSIFFLLEMSTSFAATVYIEPENYGTTWNGGQTAETTNRQIFTYPESNRYIDPYLGGIKIFDQANSRAIVAVDYKTFSNLNYSYYYLDLNANATFGDIVTTKVSLYSYFDDGFVTRFDHDKGEYYNTYDLEKGNNGQGEPIGRSFLDISGIIFAMINAHMEHAEINIRPANEYLAGIVFSKPWIIGSTEPLSAPVFSPVSSVPLPAALPLFGSALIGIGLVRMKKRKI